MAVIPGRFPELSEFDRTIEPETCFYRIDAKRMLNQPGDIFPSPDNSNGQSRGISPDVIPENIKDDDPNGPLWSLKSEKGRSP
jgi:hypothetical protein